MESIATTNNRDLLGEKATLVGYGDFGSPRASRTSDGSRRAAENIIDSVANNLIRFDYDSTLSFAQTPDSGINHPNLDRSTPEVTPVPTSSPLPIPLEGEIGKGDSGGPLLVSTDLNNSAVVGVASAFIDPDALTIPIPGYGSVDVYTALNHPATLEFLEAENLIARGAVTSQSVASTQTKINDAVNLPISQVSANSDFMNNNSDLAQAELANQNGELNFAPSNDI